MDCFGCKYHETVLHTEFNDGCICENEKAEKEDRHLNCCSQFLGKEECQYYENNI